MPGRAELNLMPGRFHARKSRVEPHAREIPCQEGRVEPHARESRVESHAREIPCQDGRVEPHAREIPCQEGRVEPLAPRKCI